MHDPWTAEKDREFFAALATGASVTKACGQVGYTRSGVYARRRNSPGFAVAWDDAVEAGSDHLEDEVVRRARDGIDKPVFYKGDVVGHVTEYSDTLLIFMLKARRPDRFRERANVELQGPGGGPVELSVTERMARLSALLTAASRRREAGEEVAWDEVAGDETAIDLGHQEDDA